MHCPAILAHIVMNVSQVPQCEYHVQCRRATVTGDEQQRMYIDYIAETCKYLMLTTGHNTTQRTTADEHQRAAHRHTLAIDAAA